MDCECRKIIDIMERVAPRKYAEDWDNVGLILGNEKQIIKRIMVCLDITEQVVEEAVSKQIDLIISHHPLIFKPVKMLQEDSMLGRKVYPLIQKNIAVFCAHTNLDIVHGGVNDILAAMLGLTNIIPLHSQGKRFKKIVVFVPVGHEDKVMNAMTSAGAGWIGKYSSCTFQVSGMGTFIPEEGSNPYIGNTGKLEKVHEIRLETIVDEDNITEIINAMIEVHPYEEVAFDIYALDHPRKEFGLGRVGMLDREISLGDFCTKVKDILGVPSLRTIGCPERKIKRIAICGGSGGEFISDAVEKHADVFITGDIKYHDAVDCRAMGLAVIDAGHFYTERPVVDYLISRLQKELISLQYNIEVMKSSAIVDPFMSVGE